MKPLSKRALVGAGGGERISMRAGRGVASKRESRVRTAGEPATFTLRVDVTGHNVQRERGVNT